MQVKCEFLHKKIKLGHEKESPIFMFHKAVPIFIFVSHLLDMPKPTFPPCKKKNKVPKKKYVNIFCYVLLLSLEK